MLCSIVAADQTRAMQDQFTGSAAAMSQQDPNKAFKVSLQERCDWFAVIAHKQM